MLAACQIHPYESGGDVGNPCVRVGTTQREVRILSRTMRRLRIGFIASALMLVIGGLAFADEGEFDGLFDTTDGPPAFVQGFHENGEGPPWLLFEEIEWRPGDGKPPWAPGTPPWAEGEGPPWLLFEEIEWRPGDGAPPWVGGPPPWADGSDDENGDGPPWLRDEEIEWRPGDGKPPWSGGPPPWAGSGGNDE
jgi:hypothetical protein